MMLPSALWECSVHPRCRTSTGELHCSIPCLHNWPQAGLTSRNRKTLSRPTQGSNPCSIQSIVHSKITSSPMNRIIECELDNCGHLTAGDYKHRPSQRFITKAQQQSKASIYVLCFTTKDYFTFFFFAGASRQQAMSFFLGSDDFLYSRHALVRETDHEQIEWKYI